MKITQRISDYIKSTSLQSDNSVMLAASCVFFMSGILASAFLGRLPFFSQEVSDMILVEASGFYFKLNAEFLEYFIDMLKADILSILFIVIAAHFAFGFIIAPCFLCLRGAVFALVLQNHLLSEGSVAAGILSGAGAIVYFVLSSAVLIFAAGRSAGMSGMIFGSLVSGRQHNELSVLYGRYLFRTVLSMVFIAAADVMGALSSSFILGNFH